MSLILLAFVLVVLTSKPSLAQGDLTGQQPSSRTSVEQDRGNGGIPPRTRVVTSSGTPEFAVTAPIAQSQAVVNALTPLGGRLLRSRPYPNLGLTGLFFSFNDGLNLRRAREALADQVPAAAASAHVYYRFAQGARLYAAEMVGVSNPVSCRVSGNVRIGLIDGPVNPGHPALAQARIVQESVLRPGERGVGSDHGTAVAALMVGQDGSGTLSGLASGAELVAISSFSRVAGDEVADIERIAAALDRMLARNVRLVNMSFAGPPNQVFETILQAARQRGLVMIAAAGNEGRAEALWPAGSPNVIAVTAVDAAMRRYVRANTGGHIEFAAPGVDLLVASGGGGAYRSGTSYAAPIVTALAARLGGRSLASVRQNLQAAAVDLGNPGRDGQFGWGLVRASGC